MLLYTFLLALPAMAFAQAASLKPYDSTALALYRAADINNDGHIDFNEKHAYYGRYDRDNNGQITRQEFTTEIDAESSHFKGHERQMYDLFDINNDNHLTESDFMHVFDINDFNDDGRVTMFEFVVYWEKVFEALEDMNTGA